MARFQRTIDLSPGQASYIDAQISTGLYASASEVVQAGLRISYAHDLRGCSMDLIALLRAVNVGGTGKLAMTDLTRICEAAGLRSVKTYIASGNVVFQTDLAEAQVKATLEQRLHAHTGQIVGVMVRTHAEMAAVLDENPFAEAAGNRVVAIFLDVPAAAAVLEGVSGQGPAERIALGRREIYVHYAAGQADTRLRIPAAALGTARNMNTVAKLVAMSAG